jgi:hypothetical protein
MTTDNTLYYGQTDPSTGQGNWNQQRFVIEQQMLQLNTSLPVRIMSVQASGVSPVGFVSIQVLVDQVTGNDKTVPHGEIPNVPYFRLQGGTNAVIIDPVAGDIGMACFSSRDITAVKSARQAAPPGSRRSHDFSDAMYIGGFLNGTPTQYIQFTEGGIIVHSPTKVTIEAPEADVVADNVNVTATTTNIDSLVNMGDLGDTLRALIDERFVAIYNAHSHPSNGAPPSVLIGAGVLTSNTKVN